MALCDSFICHLARRNLTKANFFNKSLWQCYQLSLTWQHASITFPFIFSLASVEFHFPTFDMYSAEGDISSLPLFIFSSMQTSRHSRQAGGQAGGQTGGQVSRQADRLPFRSTSTVFHSISASLMWPVSRCNQFSHLKSLCHIKWETQLHWNVLACVLLFHPFLLYMLLDPSICIDDPLDEKDLS